MRKGSITMEQSKIDRINFLARKAKAEGLSDAEKTEQQKLRAEYIAAYRQSLRTQLDNIVLVDGDGREHALKKKEK